MIVGLGNPGRDYEGTRHNVGFQVVQLAASRWKADPPRRHLQADVSEARLGDERVALVRPMTFMNLSGEAVGALARYYKIPTGDITIVLDDVALETGRLRLRYTGSAGGHNGLANIIQVLGTQDVSRLRIGVGAARGSELRSHVLSRFSADEREDVMVACTLAVDALEIAVREGFEAAMNRYNPARAVSPPKE